MKIRKEKHFAGAVALLLFSVLISGFAVYLSMFYGKTHIAKSLTEMPDPSVAVSSFFEKLSYGEYEKCDDYLLDFSVKGMAKKNENEFGEVMQAMLIDSYMYEQSGKMSVMGKEAEVTYNVTYLDFEKLEKTMKEKVNKKAEEMNFKGEDIFSEESAMQIALLVAEELKEKTEDFCLTKRIKVDLYYDGTDWKIVYSEDLENMILGME